MNARGKDSIPEIIGPLRSFGIPAAGIFDVDVIEGGGKVWAKHMGAIGVPQGRREQMASGRKSVHDALKQASANFKTEGGIGVLKGGELSTANRLFDELDRDGLFTVRKGELEDWLPELGVNDHKSTWCMAMLERLGSDPSHPDYVMPGDDDVWAFMRKIIAWMADESRDGMERV